jgi:hypothetical protein
MTVEEASLREQLARTEEKLLRLRGAASEAVDRLSGLYDNVQTGGGAHDGDHVSGIETRHIRMLHEIAKDLAFALIQQESESY